MLCPGPQATMCPGAAAISTDKQAMGCSGKVGCFQGAHDLVLEDEVGPRAEKLRPAPGCVHLQLIQEKGSPAPSKLAMA